MTGQTDENSMSPLYNYKTGQGHIQEVPIVQGAHRLYQRRGRPFLFHSDDFCTKSLQATYPEDTQNLRKMRSWGCPTLNMETSGQNPAVTTSRRSVKVMKSLLPLKLSSPKLQNARSASPVLSQSSGFGRPYTPPALYPIPLPILPPGADKNVHNPTRSSMKLHSEKYRDTPYFSPRPKLACLNDDEVCLSCPTTSSSCEESCIFQDYANSDNSAFASDNGSDNDHCHRGLGFEFWETDINHGTQERPRADSTNLSIKCRGEVRTFRTSMFVDEAAWLSNSSPLTINRNSETLLPASPRHNSIEFDTQRWLSDSSSENDDGDEDEDELGCATVLSLTTPLTPAKAHVVEVGVNSSLAALDIPPRSSSLLGIGAGRKSRMTFRDSIQTGLDLPPTSPPYSWRHQNDTSAYGYEPNYHCSGIHGGVDLARTSPPLTPTGNSGWHSPLQSLARHHQVTSDACSSQSFQTLSGKVGTLNPSQGLLSNIISDLEYAILSFPSVMLLPDAHCIPAIRSHLYQCSAGVGKITTVASLYPNQVDWRPERTIDTGQHEDGNRSKLRRSLSLSTLSTFGTVLESCPGTNTHTSRYELSPAPHFSITNGDRTLYTIFPKSTPFHRAAAYSHILAYTFLTTLTSPRPDLQSSEIAPIFTTTSHALPSKVVKVLGAPPMTARPARVEIRDGYAILVEGGSGVDMDRIELLLGRTKDCIGWLLSEMEAPDPGNVNRKELTVNALILRALVEVVKGCEQNVSVYV